MNAWSAVEIAAEALDRLLPLVVLLDPVRVALGLAQRLLDVVLDPLGRDRPRPDQGLEDEVALHVVGGAGVGAQVVGELEPAADVLAPLVRHRGQRADPGADIGRALGVVGHRGQQVQREALGALGVAGVEALDVDAEARRVAAHVVEREQPDVAVERGVLDALGHDRRRGLLEAGDEARWRFALEQQARRDRGVHAGGLDRCAVRVADAAATGIDVRPVHGERRQACSTAFFGAPPPYLSGASPKFSRSSRSTSCANGPRTCSSFASCATSPNERAVARHLLPQRRQRRLAGRIDEQRAHVVEELVADRAAHRPVAQPLAGVEDLLDPDPVDPAIPQPRQIAAGSASPSG